MALTKETITANEALKGLTEDQIKVITELSKNDESTVVGKAIGDQIGRIEQDILSASGMNKNEGEKYFDYMKRVVSSYKEGHSSVAGLKEEIETYKTSIAELEDKIKAGQGGEALAQKLKDAETRLSSLQTQYETEKTAWGDEKTGMQNEFNQFHVNSAFDALIPSMKFKKEYPESVQKTLYDAAKTSVMGMYSTDWSGEGTDRKLIFRDKDGNIVGNPANAMNPFSAKELMAAQLKDVLSTGQQGKGAGSNGGGNQNHPTIADLSTVKNRTEANNIIKRHLHEKGIPTGTREYNEKSAEILKSIDLSNLPLH